MLHRGPRDTSGSSFNVAASIKMRKFIPEVRRIARDAALQCGRIYKDAEIAVSRRALCLIVEGFNVAASIKMRKSF